MANAEREILLSNRGHAVFAGLDAAEIEIAFEESRSSSKTRSADVLWWRLASREPPSIPHCAGECAKALHVGISISIEGLPGGRACLLWRRVSHANVAGREHSVAERATADRRMLLTFVELESKFRLQRSKLRIQQVRPSGFKN